MPLKLTMFGAVVNATVHAVQYLDGKDSLMGSLMGGWDSPVHDPNDVKYRRNKSLTKGEIEAFWKSKKQKEEEHLKDISLLSPRSKKILFEETGGGSEAGLEKIIQKNGWWVRSNSAFLNEPPVIASEGPPHRYASHFHVVHNAVQIKPVGQVAVDEKSGLE
ncbi:hypothetical protein OROHE_023462 [Orobanche hederae]